MVLLPLEWMMLGKSKTHLRVADSVSGVRERGAAAGFWRDKTKGVSYNYLISDKEKVRTAKVPTHTKRHENKRQLNMLYIIHNSYGAENKIDKSCTMFFHMLNEYIPFPCAVVMNLSGFTFFLLLFLIVKGHQALKIRVACVFARIHLMHWIQRLKP